MSTAPPLFGSLETGGTSCACAVGDGLGRITRFVQFATATPDDTIKRARAFFALEPHLDGLGIAAFGPLDLDPESATFGYVLDTPKPDWQHADLVGGLCDLAAASPVLATDVSAAAYGEHRFGSAQADRAVLYVTVGTGIGGGLVNDGQIWQGASHAEMGHLPVRRRAGDTFAGACPYHGDCLEGMASGAAILARTGIQARDLSDDDPVWEIVAYYIGRALATWTYTLMPHRIVLGGGISQRPRVLSGARDQMAQAMAGYALTQASHDPTTYVVQPGLGKRSGLIGAMALARVDYQKRHITSPDRGSRAA